MARFVGVDPGAKGSFCLLDTGNKHIEFQPTPTIDVTAAVLYDWILAEHAQEPIQMIGVEDVHAIFGTSAKSNFNFGFNVGQVRTIASMTNIGVDLVKPKEWQKSCGIPSLKAVKGATARKKVIAQVALRLYPGTALFGLRGGLIDGRADALMIAHYMSIRYGGKA